MTVKNELKNMIIGEGAWNQYFYGVNEQCYRQEERLVKQIMKKESVDEKLKAENQLEWVGRVNGIKLRVEEIVLANYME